MPSNTDKFDVTDVLEVADAVEPLPIAELIQPSALRPFGEPRYLAGFVDAVEFPILGSATPGLRFTCPDCGGTATATYGHTAAGPFNLTCAGKCNGEGLRKSLMKLAPLAFQHRDDLWFPMPAALRDQLVERVEDSTGLYEQKECRLAVERLRRQGQLSLTEYKAHDGQTILGVVRCAGDHRKSFMPVRCAVDASGNLTLEITFGRGKLPPYRLDDLVRRPDAPILVTEGEKAADAAAVLFPDLVAVTTACGALNAGKTDFSPFHGRDVIIWRDNDDPGVRYQRSVAALALSAHAKSVRAVALPSGLPEGWDLADDRPENLSVVDLREAINAAALLHWDDVKDALPKADVDSWPPFRLPDGLFAKREPVRSAIERALEHLDPGCKRGPWLTVINAVHHALGDSGFELADDWSKRDASTHKKYVEGEVRRLFDGFASAPWPHPAGLLGLFCKAMKASKANNPDEEMWEPNDRALALAYVADFEKDHRKVKQGKDVFILIQEFTSGRYELAPIDARNADSLYKSRKAPNFKGDVTNVFKLWENAQLIEPLRLVFKPDGNVAENEHNLFRGLDVKPAQGGSYKLFREHLDRVAAHNGDSGRYLWKVIAWRLQHLGTFVPAMPLFIGREGGGKSTITNVIARLLAPYSIRLSDPDKFIGRNNACLEGKLFVQLEEMNLGRSEHYDSRLKHYITSDQLDVEEKYRAQWSIPNTLFVALTSNKRDAIRVTEFSRRFAAYEVIDHFKGNQPARDHFFGEMNAELEAGGYEALAYDLLNEDLTGFSPAEIPKTNLLLELAGADADSDPLRSWWRAILERGSIKKTDSAVWPDKIEKDELYETYCGWCEGNGSKARNSVISKAEWAKQLARLVPGLDRKRLTVAGRRDHFFLLPDYEACCAAFEEYDGRAVERAAFPPKLEVINSVAGVPKPAAGGLPL